MSFATDPSKNQGAQLTDFYERRDQRVEELLKLRRNQEKVMASLLDLKDQLDAEKSKKAVARSAEVTFAVIGIVGVALGAYSKKFGVVPPFNLNVAGNRLMLFSGVLTGVSVVGGETYISLRREDMQELSIEIDAEVEILRSVYNVSSAVLDAILEN